MTWQAIANWGRDLLFPAGVSCPVCRRLSHGQLLCASCQDVLTRDQLAPAFRLSRNRLRHLDATLSLWPHAGVAAELVRLLKDQCLAGAAPYLGQWLAEGLMAGCAWDHPAGRLPDLGADVAITWVTMPEGRRKTRGIDHGRLLAEGVASVTGYPVMQLLQRTGKAHHTQRGLSRAARQKNMAGVFTAVPHAHHTVILVDDVLTTGATGEAAAQVLKAAGASQVILLTVTKA